MDEFFNHVIEVFGYDYGGKPNKKRKNREEKKLCYNCGKSGHIAAHCKNPNKKSRGSPKQRLPSLEGRDRRERDRSDSE